MKKVLNEKKIYKTFKKDMKKILKESTKDKKKKIRYEKFEV